VPGAAEALSGATLGDVADSDVEAAEHDMTRKLKEFDLERRIALGKGRLKQPGSFKEQTEYDEVLGRSRRSSGSSTNTVAVSEKSDEVLEARKTRCGEAE